MARSSRSTCSPRLRTATPDDVQPYIRRDLPNKLGISPSDTTVHGNRDALDFPLFWRMVDNLSSNGTQNNWHSIRNASVRM